MITFNLKLASKCSYFLCDAYKPTTDPLLVYPATGAVRTDRATVRGTSRLGGRLAHTPQPHHILLRQLHSFKLNQI